MVVVVAVEELARLLAVNRDISTIKVQHDFCRWLLVLLDEVVPQHLMGLHYCLPIGVLFHPAQRRLARQRLHFTERRLKRLGS